jgi:hypothetical protein
MSSRGMRNANARNIDFGFLKGAVGFAPTTIPSDIDMVFEHNGHFLFGEWKAFGEGISVGQEIMLRKLATKPNCSVLKVEYHHGEDGLPIIKNFYRIKHNRFIRIGRGQEQFSKYVTKWWGLTHIKDCK